MEAPQANNLAPPSGELSAEQTEGVHLRRSRWTSTLKSQISILHFRRSRAASTLKSQISNLKSSPQSGCNTIRRKNEQLFRYIK